MKLLYMQVQNECKVNIEAKFMPSPLKNMEMISRKMESLQMGSLVHLDLEKRELKENTKPSNMPVLITFLFSEFVSACNRQL